MTEPDKMGRLVRGKMSLAVAMPIHEMIRQEQPTVVAETNLYI